MSLEKQINDLIEQEKLALRVSSVGKKYIPIMELKEIPELPAIQDISEPPLSWSLTIGYCFWFLTAALMFFKVLGYDLDWKYIFGPVIIYFVFEGLYFIGNNLLRRLFCKKGRK